MAKFEVVSRFGDDASLLPKRKTAFSAGYDFVVAEDIIIPPWTIQHNKIWDTHVKDIQARAEEDFIAPEMLLEDAYDDIYELSELVDLVKKTGAKPTLVATGVKCKMEPDTSLELYVRSSAPLKSWLMLANGVGVVDADYYNNPDNEGEIFFQIFNMSPLHIQLRKGDVIGQGIIRKYEITEDDEAAGVREGGFGSTGENYG